MRWETFSAFNAFQTIWSVILKYVHLNFEVYQRAIKLKHFGHTLKILKEKRFNFIWCIVRHFNQNISRYHQTFSFRIRFQSQSVLFFFCLEDKQPKRSLKDGKDMLTEKRWQKWDAIKHFICVIEFLWVIAQKTLFALNHYNENKTSFRWRRKKNATHFTNEKYYFMCCHLAVSIYIFVSFRSLDFSCSFTLSLYISLSLSLFIVAYLQRRSK